MQDYDSYPIFDHYISRLQHGIMFQLQSLQPPETEMMKQIHRYYLYKEVFLCSYCVALGDIYRQGDQMEHSFYH